MTLLADYSPGELRRWLVSGAIVVLAHAGIVAVATAHWRGEIGEPGELGTAIVIDLEPLAAPVETPDVAPGPEQMQAEATPEQKPVEKTEEKIEDIPRAPEPDVALAEPLKPEPPTPAESAPPVPMTSAPQVAKGTHAVVPPSWTRQVVGLLEKNKRYPSDARARHQEGVVQLAFSLDRQGRVTESHIVKSSGSAALDNETLELIKRAQPFPPLPSNIGDKLDLTVPIRFNIR